MIIQVQRFIILPQLQKGHDPAVLVRLDQGLKSQRVEGLTEARHANAEAWGILYSRLHEAPNWSWNKTGEQIVVPLFAYLVPDPSPEAMIHFGAQTGALAVAHAAKLNPKKVLVCLGELMRRPDGRPGFQAWAGYAACVSQ